MSVHAYFTKSLWLSSITLTLSVVKPSFGAKDTCPQRDGFGFSYTSTKVLRAKDLYLLSDHIVTNEIDIAKAKAQFESSNHETYISVGTDRVLFSALLARSNAILMADMNEDILWYNQTNLALLYISKDRADYEDLRVRASFETWQTRIRESDLSSELRRVVDNKRTWDLWNGQVRGNLAIIQWIHTSPFQKNSHSDLPSSPFADLNYIYIDKYYEFLKQRLKEGKIDILHVDLYNRSSSSQITKWLQCHQQKVGIMDMSNVPSWVRSQYTGSRYYINGFIDLYQRLKPYAQPDSRMLYVYLNGSDIQYDPFEYRFFTFDALEKQKAFSFKPLQEMMTKDYSHGPVYAKTIKDWVKTWIRKWGVRKTPK